LRGCEVNKKQADKPFYGDFFHRFLLYFTIVFLLFVAWQNLTVMLLLRRTLVHFVRCAAQAKSCYSKANSGIIFSPFKSG
jgi:hypothetical protein